MCRARKHPLSKLHHQRCDGIAASNPPELAVKMLRRFLGIAFVVFLDDFNQPCLDRKFDTDRKSTRLNSSHLGISYAVFCLKKNHSRDRRQGGLMVAMGTLLHAAPLGVA